MISDQSIKEAEELLIDGKIFDEERIEFIKKIDSCDLLAVPGSGKTTALLAKLYCLSKKLPLKDGSGILVLSHTNAAVNEIENKLRPLSPKLFDYPNFVGTIQSFVNTYLANQACFELYGSYIRENDNDIYQRESEKFYNSLQWKRTEPKGLKNKLFGRLNYGKNDLSFSEKEENVKSFLRNFELDIINKKIIYNNRTLYTSTGTGKHYYSELYNWKTMLWGQGFLNYKDSFLLGELILNNKIWLKSLLRSRFQFIFIDEMQDLDKEQIDIIDQIFFDEESSVIIQRIGDINQSIYNSGKRVKASVDWVPRNQVFLNGSNRLTSDNADIVNFLTLDRQQDDNGKPRFLVKGYRTLETPIKPHLLLFDKKSLHLLDVKFSELIQAHSLHETKEGREYGFKIIGWNAKWDDDREHDGKLRLENIFKSYSKEKSSNKESYESLSKYIQLFDHEKRTLEAARKAVLNALVHILRIEKKTYSLVIRGRETALFYTKAEMIAFIKAGCNGSDYELFKSNLYEWSFSLAVKENYIFVFDEVKSFVYNEFKEWFDLECGLELSDFIGNTFEPISIAPDSDIAAEKSANSIKIDIGTVHSSKGQTHCATMYVETAYQRPPYELPKIAKKSNPLLLQYHCCSDTYDKQALKMMYVGFSRPTHLLCYACLKENITENIEEYCNVGWEVLDLTAKEANNV